MYTPKTLEALRALFLAQHGTSVVIGNLPHAFSLLATSDASLSNRKKWSVVWAKDLWDSIVLALAITTAIPPDGSPAYPTTVNNLDVVTQPIKAASWTLLKDAEKWEDLTQIIEKLMMENYAGNATALVPLMHASEYADSAWKWNNVAARALLDSMDEV